MPDDVNGAAMTSDGTYAYAAGGYSFSAPDYTQQLYRFDPAANMWLTLAPMADPFTMGSAVYYPGTNKVYVFARRLARHRVPREHEDLRHCHQHVEFWPEHAGPTLANGLRL